MKGFGDVEQDPHTPAVGQCSFHTRGVPFHRLYLKLKKNNLSVQYIYLPQDLVLPSAATFHGQEAAISHTWADEPLD